MRLFGSYRLSTFQVIAFGFAALILTGTLLLFLPVSSRQPGSAGFMDCLFTATSAVCVTGLVVRDTATCWITPSNMPLLLHISAWRPRARRKACLSGLPMKARVSRMTGSRVSSTCFTQAASPPATAGGDSVWG